VVWCLLFNRSAGGFWNPEETPQLDAIETDLIKLCDQHGNGWAAYVQRLDTPGLREYYVYFGGEAAMNRVLPDLKAKHPNYRMEFDQINDPKWHIQQVDRLGFSRRMTNAVMERRRASGNVKSFSAVRPLNV